MEKKEKNRKLPLQIKVEKIIESRYTDNKRPLSWDLRKEGRDIVQTAEGREVTLYSEGSQSPPQPGWVLILKDGDDVNGFRWTLYGIPS